MLESDRPLYRVDKEVCRPPSDYSFIIILVRYFFILCWANTEYKTLCITYVANVVHLYN